MRRLLSLAPWMIVLLIVGLLGGLGWRASQDPDRAADGCPVTGAVRHYLVLIDASDPLHGSILTRIAKRIYAIAGAAGASDRFTLVVLGGRGEPDIIDIFSACNVANSNWAGEIYRQKKAKEFVEPLEGFIASLSESSRPSSPILESIDTLLHRPDVFESGPTQVWIVSDFLQNSPAVSHYRGRPAIPRQFRSKIPPGRLAGVRLLYIRRPGLRHLQSGAHQNAFIEHLSAFSETPPVLEIY